MARSKTDSRSPRIAGLCDCGRGPFPVTLSGITCEGCVVELPVGLSVEFDFLQLRIAGRIDVNGRVLWQKGRRAQVRFFGQIHPLAVAGLGCVAA